jgi:hypothetical protein
VSTSFKEKIPALFLYISMAVNLATFMGKVALGIYQVSGFLFVSALVTLSAFITKLVYAIASKNPNPSGTNQAFLVMALSISVGAIAYISYMIRLFYFPKISSYDIYESLIIALFAFVDLGWAIYSLIKEAKQKNTLALGLKAGSLTNGLSALVLTQIALLSFTNPGKDFSFQNAWFGVLSGTIGLVIGFAMIAHYGRLTKKAKID